MTAREKDNLTEWIRIGPPEVRTRVYTFAFQPERPDELIVGTRPEGFYRFNTERISWQRIDVDCKFTLGIGPNQHSVAISHRNSDVLFLAAEQHGILRTENGGKSWVYANTGLRGKDTLALNGICFCFHPQDRRMMLYGSDGGLYKSKDIGQTWSHVQEGLPKLCRNLQAEGRYWATSVWRIGVHSAFPDRVFAGIYCAPPDESAGMYVSDDFGESWNLCSTGLPDGKFHDLNDHKGVYDFAISNIDPGMMFVGLRTGLFETRNGGVSWQAAGPFRMPVSAVCFHPYNAGTTFVGLNDGSVCRSTDHGKTWSEVSRGLPLNIRAERVAFRFKNYDGTEEERTEYRWRSRIWKLGINPKRPDELYAATPFGLFQRKIG